MGIFDWLLRKPRQHSSGIPTKEQSRSDVPSLIRPLQFTPPKEGIDVSECFEVDLYPLPPGKCLSVAAHQATILISRELVEQISAVSLDAWTTEEERMALIRARRATALLQHVEESAGDGECTPVQTQLLGEADYLIGELLLAGQVAVLAHATGQRVQRIAVRYEGNRAGPLAGWGHISCGFTCDGGMFYAMHWWQS